MIEGKVLLRQHYSTQYKRFLTPSKTHFRQIILLLREFDYFFWKEIEQRKLASVEAMDGRNKGSRYSCIATLRIYVPERTLREKILMQIGIKPEIAVSDIPL